MLNLRAQVQEITDRVRPAIERENLLLAMLPSLERLRLISRCESVELAVADVLYEQGKPMSHVYFPIAGFISQIFTLDEHSRVEVGLIGAEGMLGSSLKFGVNVALEGARVLGAGSALRLEAAQFLLELKRSPALEQALNRYLYVLTSQLTQASACSRFHCITARLARWFLMIRDRGNSDEFQLTHSAAAFMLGVRREGITQAACLMQERKWIRYHRGVVTIVDVSGLRAAACSCYRAMTQVYSQVMLDDAMVTPLESDNCLSKAQRAC